MTETHMELGLFHGDADGECHRCHQVYEIRAYAAFHDDQWTCPDCADAISPGFSDIIRGLDLVFNGITLDLFTRRVLLKDLDSVTWSLRKLADLVDDIAADKAQLHLTVKVVEGFAPDEQGQPIGVSIDRTIETAKEPTS
ncbi:hypothetical protein ACWEJ6_44620 [Nonomuraea sp. NPDC004702]